MALWYEFHEQRLLESYSKPLRLTPMLPLTATLPPTSGQRRLPAVPRQPETDGCRLIVISNRLPLASGKVTPAGGLAVAVQAALQQNGGIWLGWSGKVTEKAELRPHLIEAGAVTYATLDLTPEEYARYYNGFSNRMLWPLFHYRTDLVEFRREDLDFYLQVNRKFALAVAPLLQPRDLIWVQDYHLIPLGQELRRLGVTQPVGFFLHTPFPPLDILRTLPDHRKMMRAFCAYDLAGFQTEGDCRNFADYLLRETGAELRGKNRFRSFDRLVTARAFPVGIDVATVARQAAASRRSRHTCRLLESLHERTLIIGVDRLDYSKGLLARFQAFEKLVECYPETRGKVTLMQIAPHSRTEVPEYLEIRRSLEAAAGHINGRFAEFDWTPLRYLNKSFRQRTLAGFFRSSRIGLVTPLRDGMNLVAKEYVASQDGENPGVLVLSCFAGAAEELREALIVNPFDTMAIVEAMRLGLAMPVEERRERWQAMMTTLRRNDIDAWRHRFVEQLAQSALEPACRPLI
jgi:trehalose 6-phosphate synthase